MYKCYYIGGGGEKISEGVFKVIRETDMYITLEMVDPGLYCLYPHAKIRKLPKEGGGAKPNSWTAGAQYWDGCIQVYHDQRGIPFIYEPIKK